MAIRVLYREQENHPSQSAVPFDPPPYAYANYTPISVLPPKQNPSCHTRPLKDAGFAMMVRLGSQIAVVVIAVPAIVVDSVKLLDGLATWASHPLLRRSRQDPFRIAAFYTYAVWIERG